MSSTRLAPIASLIALVACGHGQSPDVYRASSPQASTAYRGGNADVAAETAPHIVSPQERPGLGTSFGETRLSRVRHTPFVRDSDSPFAQATLHYNDAEGVRAAFAYHRAGIGVARLETGGISVTVVDEYGEPLPGGAAGGRFYVAGRDGQRYSIAIRNHSGSRFEAVASVDGLDVIDGRPASYGKRGYILQPYGTLLIDGFRTSDDTVAAFRFGTVSDSYAARTSGDRNVGVIGVALFSERGPAWTGDEIRRRDSADPFPDRYAPAPR